MPSPEAHSCGLLLHSRAQALCRCQHCGVHAYHMHVQAGRSASGSLLPPYLLCPHLSPHACTTLWCYRGCRPSESKHLSTAAAAPCDAAQPVRLSVTHRQGTAQHGLLQHSTAWRSTAQVDGLQHGAQREGRGRGVQVIQENEGTQGSLDVQYTCRCSFIQIYQENISDLLRPHPGHSGHSLPLRSSPDSGVFVEGLSEHVIVNGAPPLILQHA